MEKCLLHIREVVGSNQSKIQQFLFDSVRISHAIMTLSEKGVNMTPVTIYSDFDFKQDCIT